MACCINFLKHLQATLITKNNVSSDSMIRRPNELVAHQHMVAIMDKVGSIHE